MWFYHFSIIAVVEINFWLKRFTWKSYWVYKILNYASKVPENDVSVLHSITSNISLTLTYYYNAASTRKKKIIIT